MSVKLIYKDISVGADDDAEVSATGAASLSTLTLLPYGSGNSKLYATLEPNRWLLDGVYDVYDDGNVSFWSDDLSGSDCAFTPPPTITVDFDSNYTSLGIFFAFDAVDYAAELTITWYQGSTQLASATFTPDSSNYFCEETVAAYNKVVISFGKTSLPERRIKLDQIMFGLVRVFERDELRNVNIIQECNAISEELAINTLDWTLSSASAVEYIFQQKQPVEAYDDDTLTGVFYIEDSSRAGERLYTISCIDAIGVLDDSLFPDARYSAYNAYTLAQDIIDGAFDLDMDTALQSKTVTGVLKNRTRRQALQQLCFAIGAVADTSGTNKIRIFVLPTSDPATIPESRTRLGGSVEASALVTAVNVTAHSYATSGGNQPTVDINGTRYYDTQTITRIENPNVTATDKINEISITDATLVSPDNVAEIAQIVYDYYQRREKHTLSFRVDGEQVGDYVTTVTPWGDTLTGNIERMSIVLSGIAVSDTEMIGE